MARVSYCYRSKQNAWSSPWASHPSFFFNDANPHYFIRNRLHLFLTWHIHISMFVLSLSIQQSSLFLLLLLSQMILSVTRVFRAEIPSGIRRRSASIEACYSRELDRAFVIAGRILFNVWELLLFVTRLVARRTQIRKLFRRVSLAHCF